MGNDYHVTYGYDPKGRFASVGWQMGGKEDTVTYSYLTNSDLLKGLTSASGHTTGYGYEARRNVKTSVQNSFGPSVISRYDYAYDAIGRRTSVKNSGTAFAENAFNKYAYNDRNEVTGSSRNRGSDTENVSLPVEPEHRSYVYDPIGNRKGAVQGSDTLVYTTDNLNRYTAVLENGVTEAPAYDEDGNLTRMAGKSYGMGSHLD